MTNPAFPASGDGPTVVGPTARAATGTPIAALDGSYIEWGNVVAGAVAAAAISFLLMAFGSALGLMTVSPWPDGGVSLTMVGVFAAIWFVLVQVGSYVVGGYLAGRLRQRFADAKQEEVEFRDGAHGFFVWALGVLLSAALVAGGAMSAAQGTASTVAMSPSAQQEIAAYAVDTLLRTSGVPGGQAANAAASQEVRTQMARVLVADALRPTVPAADRTYLTQQVAARAGVDAAEAGRRVDSAIAQVKTSLDHARKATVVLGFVTAAALLIAAAAAWWAAVVGGQHRDASTFWSGLTTTRMPRLPRRA